MPSDERINELIWDHLDVAQRLARAFTRRSGTPQHDLDYESAALNGLWKAARTWDETRSVFFAL